MSPRTHFLCVLATASLCLTCLAAPIPGLFNTGFDSEGNLIDGSGITDAHYELVESPDQGAAGPAAETLNPGFPVGPWLEEGPDSRWIAPQADQSTGNAPGIYVYRTTVDLSAFDPDTVRITGRWSTDNGGVDILVNGEGTGIASNGFTDWTNFELSEGFIQGINVLEFQLENAGDAANPTGIRVEMDGQATLIGASRIPGLFGTGLASDGSLLGPSGEVDPHYTLIESADPEFSGPDAVTLDAGFPVGPWIEEGEDSAFPGSRWIAPRAAQSQGNNGGVYRYQTSFSLAGFDPDTVKISGRWATDDAGMGIFLNGEDLFISSNGFVDWAEFEITEGFREGENTLEFAVENGGEARNPTGLRVDILDASGERTGGAPPSIIAQPQSRRVVSGDSISLSVTAGGSPPFTYQWTRNGENVANGTARTLSLPSITPAEAGEYRVSVSNEAGSAATNPITIAVLQPIPGLFATGIGDDGLALNDLEIDPHYALVDNADGDSEEALVHDSQVFPIVEGPWVANSESSQWIAPRGDTAEAAEGDYTYRLTFDLTGLDPQTVLLRGRWATDNAGLDIRLNGASTGLTNATQFGAFTNFRIEDAPFLSGENTLDFVLNNAGNGPTGLIVDSLSGGAEIASVEDRAPTFVVKPPGSLETFRGEDITLHALADGTPPLTYAWSFQGAVVGDTPDLTLTDIQPDQAGDYVLEVTNAQGSITSNPVTVTILEPIPGLFNTGVDDEGDPLEDLAEDPHYKLLSDPEGASPPAIALDTTIFPIVNGPWIANNDGSQWIGVQDDNNGSPGEYIYRLTFDLSAFDPDNVHIEGDWAADDGGGPLILNGTPLDMGDAPNFTSFIHFRIEEGFVPGLNTLDIPVVNGGEAPNPTGVRIDGLRGGGLTEDPNLIGPSMTPFGQLDQSEAVTRMTTLRNSGGTQTLSITGARVVGEHADLFTLGAVPPELPPNESVAVEIMVDPRGASGHFAAALELTTNDPSTPVQQFDISAFIPVSPNLVAHYKLDETNAGQLLDASGFGRHGTYNATQGSLTLGGDPLAAGTSAAFMEGAFAETGPDVLPVFENAFSISLWHTPGETNNAASLISRGDGQGDPFALVASGSTLFWFSGGGDPAVTAEDALTLGENHHIVITVADNTATLYINGSATASGPTENFADQAQNALQFGAAHGIIGINGILDDIQVYAVALDAAEVAGLFASPGSVVGQGDPQPEEDAPLSISLLDNSVKISWPTTAGDGPLMRSADLQTWTPVEESPIEEGTRFSITLPITGFQEHFRLEP